jgi:superfamily II DNA helicase RecQ
LLVDDPAVEDNEAVQQRIIQACKWFGEKMETQICNVLQSLEVETDNSALKKSMKEAIANFYQEAYILLACYKACQSGFSVKEYCEVKAKASIEKLSVKTESRKASTADTSKAEPNPMLLKTLKIWRDVLAGKMNVPVYRVIPQQTMYDISVLLPDNEEDLKKIKGIGKRKLDTFGKAILDIVRNYREMQENDHILK